MLEPLEKPSAQSIYTDIDRHIDSRIRHHYDAIRHQGVKSPRAEIAGLICDELDPDGKTPPILLLIAAQSIYRKVDLLIADLLSAEHAAPLKGTA